MRRPLSASLLALLVLWSALTGGVAPVAGAGPGEDVHVSGTVTGLDGTPASDAVVLIGEDATLTKFSPDELRDLAGADPRNLTVVPVGTDGRFRATVPWSRAEAAVAVSDGGVSDLVYLGQENATVDLALYERRPQTVHAHLGAVSADERRAELYVNLVNSGDAAVANLSVTLVALPDGWSVAGVRTDGSYHPDERTLTWASVPPDGKVDTTVALTVPPETPVGEYTVELRARSDSHPVDVAPETVEVLPKDTPGPTTIPPPGDRTTPTPTGRRAGTTSPAGASAPGFGTGAALAALALAAALIVRRR